VCSSGESDDGDRGRAWSRRCKVVKVEVRISELSKAVRKLRREGSRGGGGQRRLVTRQGDGQERKDKSSEEDEKQRMCQSSGRPVTPSALIARARLAFFSLNL
jgi:hypothetical protein